MWLISTTAIVGNLPVELKSGEYIVGRSRKAHVVIEDRTVSKRHAKLVREGKGVLVTDLGSLNGLFVNGQKVKSSRAAVTDEIQFGAVRCRLSSSPISSPEMLDGLSTVQVLPGALATVDISGLTPAQQEVLGLALQGLDERSIAQRTARSPGTVHSHMKAIHEYFNVHSRAELIVKVTQVPPK